MEKHPGGTREQYVALASEQLGPAYDVPSVKDGERPGNRHVASPDLGGAGRGPAA